METGNIKVQVATRNAENHGDEVWVNDAESGTLIRKGGEWRAAFLRLGAAWGRRDQDLTGHIALQLVCRVYL